MNWENINKFSNTKMFYIRLFQASAIVSQINCRYFTRNTFNRIINHKGGIIYCSN